MHVIRFAETLWQDLRYALRVLRKNPGFTGIAILSLALAIGANTALYSVIHAVLLRPLPYPEPDRLLRLQQAQTQSQVTMQEFEFWKENNHAFLSVAGYRGGANQFLRAGNRTAWIQTLTVTADFFRTLGITPQLGREFDATETRTAGPQAIVLSQETWQNTFGADPKTVGQIVKVDDVSYTVVGVLPRFWFPESADAYVPLRSSGTASDLGTNTEMIARLKPGVALDQARQEMALLTERFRSVGTDLETPYPGLTVVRYQDWLVGDVRANLLLLFGAVAFLLCIACFNLAGLLLARLTARRREIAMRVALGGSRGRLLRQFLIENMLLTAGGGLLGLLGAKASLSALLAWIPFDLPVSAPARVDIPVLSFTLAVSLAIGIAFSVAPALMTSRLDLQQALRAGGHDSAGVRQRTRSFLVAGEVALSVTLLVGAGLLIQSLYNMYQQRLGFDPHGVMTFFVATTAEQRKNPAEIPAFHDTLRQRLMALPGIREAAAVNKLPLTSQSNYPTEREGHPEQPISAEIRIVTPSYFQTMAIPIVRGRSLNSGDIAAAQGVILVSEDLARHWWGESSPLGDYLVVGRFHGKMIEDTGEKPREVIGIVADTKNAYLTGPPKPTVYLPLAQTPWYDIGMNWVVRGHFTAGFGDQVRGLVAESDPRQRVERLRSMDQIVAATTADSRFNALLFGIFAGLAIAVAAIGIYGLLAFSVARRTQEIGTRMALGATRSAVLQLILRQGVVLVSIGLVAGLGGAFVVARSLAPLLFGVRAADPLSFAAVAGLMLLVGLFASYVPARRATRVDPIVALRDE